MTDFKQVADDLAAGMGALAKAEPETMTAFKTLMGGTVGKDGELSIKVKELIAVAIAITARCDGCIAHHVKLAVAAGVTRGEMVETIGVAQLMGGGPSTVYGVEALKAYDQFSAA